MLWNFKYQAKNPFISNLGSGNLSVHCNPELDIVKRLKYTWDFFKCVIQICYLCYFFTLSVQTVA